jgi:hypothetical protein
MFSARHAYVARCIAAQILARCPRRVPKNPQPRGEADIRGSAYPRSASPIFAVHFGSRGDHYHDRLWLVSEAISPTSAVEWMADAPFCLHLDVLGPARLTANVGPRTTHETSHSLSGKTRVEPSFPVRRMSRLPRWYEWVFSIGCLGTMGLVGWFNNSWFGVIPFLLVVFLGWHRHTRIRCPQCSRRLRASVVTLDSHRDRFYYDCRDCQITWDPRYVMWSD